MPIYHQRVETQLKSIPYGNAGIEESAKHLIKLVKEYRRNKEIRFKAEDIVQRCPNKDYMCEIHHIYNWVKKNIRFERDPYFVEMLRSPDITLRRRNGDCDDHVILLNSLLQSIGYPTRIVLLASNRPRPDIWNHVLTEVGVQTGPEQIKWIPLDTTVKRAKVGWLPPAYKYKRMYIGE